MRTTAPRTRSSSPRKSQLSSSSALGAVAVADAADADDTGVPIVEGTAAASAVGAALGRDAPPSRTGVNVWAGDAASLPSSDPNCTTIKTAPAKAASMNSSSVGRRSIVPPDLAEAVSGAVRMIGRRASYPLIRSRGSCAAGPPNLVPKSRTHGCGVVGEFSIHRTNRHRCTCPRGAVTAATARAGLGGPEPHLPRRRERTAVRSHDGAVVFSVHPPPTSRTGTRMARALQEFTLRRRRPVSGPCAARRGPQVDPNLGDPLRLRGDAATL